MGNDARENFKPDARTEATPKADFSSTIQDTWYREPQQKPTRPEEQQPKPPTDVANNSDSVDKVPPTKDVLNTFGSREMPVKDSLPAVAAEEPSEGSIDAALKSIQDADVSDTAKDAASAIVSGKIEDVQKILQGLEQDPYGKDKLEQLAKDLGKVFGTDVDTNIGFDGKFGLSFMTQQSSQAMYQFEHGPNDPPIGHKNSTTTLSISSTGDPRASSVTSTQFGHSNPQREYGKADGDTEATRLQALGVRFLNNQPMGYKPADLGRPNHSENIPGVIRPQNDNYIEVPPYRY